MTFMIQCTNKGSQNSLIREVDPVGVDGPGGPVGQDLVAVLALHLHRLVLVHESDVLRQVAPVGWIGNFNLLHKILHGLFLLLHPVNCNRYRSRLREFTKSRFFTCLDPKIFPHCMHCASVGAASPFSRRCFDLWILRAPFEMNCFVHPG